MLIGVLAGTLLGADALRGLPRDVFPDLSTPIFNVIVQNPAMGAEELESAIAVPMEVALSGLPDARRVRSNSTLGVASVTIEFEADADYQRSRQLVAERIAIDSYGEMIRYLANDDPTTRRMLEEIMAVEEEHADELADLLVAFPS